jgi:hypothetical protein
MNKLNLNFVNMLLVAVLAVVLLVNVISIAGVNTLIKSPPNVTVTAASPTIEVIAIKEDSCADCADVQQIIDSLKQSGQVTVSKDTVLSSTDKDAQALITKYTITRLPVIMMKGDIDKLPENPMLEKSGDVMLLRQLPPPYFDIATKKVKGLVDVTYLTAPLCQKCADITLLSKQLGTAGVVMGKETSVVYDSDDGKALVKKYNLTGVPTAIFSPDAKEYQIFEQAWQTAGTVADDGSYVLRQLMPPYIDIKTDKLRGFVDVVYLSDKSCADCYNASMHKTILVQNFGLAVDKETDYDVASADGAKLVKSYNITSVPTVILSGDIGAYPSLGQAWEQVGTVEKDGSLIFRNIALLQVAYKDLATGKVVPASAAPEVAPEDTVDTTE